MASQVAIVNAALVKLGADRITSVDDNTKAARIAKEIWPIKRDAELASHPWTFAKAREQLPASSTAPAFGWARAFPTPADYLTMVEVGENYVMYLPQHEQAALFEIEGQAILCDEGSPLRIRYIKRVENVGLWSPMFVEAFACRLAAEMAEALTQSLSKRQAAWEEYAATIRHAKRVNAIEQPPQRAIDVSWWLAR